MSEAASWEEQKTCQRDDKTKRKQEEDDKKENNEEQEESEQGRSRSEASVFEQGRRKGASDRVTSSPVKKGCALRAQQEQMPLQINKGTAHALRPRKSAE